MDELKPCLKQRGHSAETRAKMSAARIGKHYPNAQTHGITNTSIYGVWQSMRQRCNNPNRTKYKDYGARGIKVCDEWQNAETFAKWANENGYQPGLQIDRIDNNGDYSPENCRFVTPRENSRNRRNTKYLTLNGETKSVAEWCEIVNISPFTIYWWYRQRGRKYAEKRVGDALR